MLMDEAMHTSNPYSPNLATGMILNARENCATMQRYRGLKIRSWSFGGFRTALAVLLTLITIYAHFADILLKDNNTLTSQAS